MSSEHTLLALICVIAVAGGQLLFKRVGIEIEAMQGWLHLRVILLAGLSFAVYAAATLLWIHLLRSVELSRAYPFMALSFVLVPFLSSLLFGDRITFVYAAGVVMIVVGVLVIARST